MGVSGVQPTADKKLFDGFVGLLQNSAERSFWQIA